MSPIARRIACGTATCYVSKQGGMEMGRQNGSGWWITVWLAIAVIVLLVSGIPEGPDDCRAEAKKAKTGVEKRKLPQVRVTLGRRTIVADVANTDRSRIEGLLGWTGITEERGMLLDFGLERNYAIHMQGMKFPIDALWADSAGKIKMIYHSIQPDSGVAYPSLFPSAYCLEIAAGFCKKHGIEVGQKIHFGTIAD
ncbi:MAG: DUF192 domain-containing protein [Pseudomonadota bacterium]